MIYDVARLQGFQTMAIDMIADAGEPAHVIKAGAATGDPWNPVAGSDIAYPVMVFIEDHRVRNRSGTVISAIERRAYLASGIEPGKGDRVAVGLAADASGDVLPQLLPALLAGGPIEGVRFYEIDQIKVVSLNGQHVYYELTLTR